MSRWIERVVVGLLLVAGLASLTAGVHGQEPDVESMRVLRQLSTPADLDFDRQPLPDVISFLSMVGGVEFANPEVLPKKVNVKLKASGIALHDVLSLALLPTQYIFRVRDGKVVFLKPSETRKTDFVPAPPPAAKVRKQMRALKRAKIKFDFEGGDLRTFLSFMESRAGFSIVVHERAVKAAGVVLEKKKIGTLEYSGKLLSAFDKVLEPHGLTVVHRHGVLLVTSVADAKGKTTKPSKGSRKGDKASSPR